MEITEMLACKMHHLNKEEFTLHDGSVVRVRTTSTGRPGVKLLERTFTYEQLAELEQEFANVMCIKVQDKVIYTWLNANLGRITEHDALPSDKMCNCKFTVDGCVNVSIYVMSDNVNYICLTSDTVGKMPMLAAEFLASETEPEVKTESITPQEMQNILNRVVFETESIDQFMQLDKHTYFIKHNEETRELELIDYKNEPCHDAVVFKKLENKHNKAWCVPMSFAGMAKWMAEGIHSELKKKHEYDKSLYLCTCDAGEVQFHLMNDYVYVTVDPMKIQISDVYLSMR